MTTGIINTAGLLDQLRDVFLIILGVLACVAVWAGFKGKFGAALAVVAIILVGCGVWGIVALFQSGAGAGLAAKVASLFLG